MKLIIFSLVFLIVLVSTTLAAGLEITEMDVHVEYDEAYTYRLEDRNRKDSTTVSLTNNSKIDVDILPGSTVTFTVRVENTFQGENPDFRGVVARITIEEIDDGADLDADSIDFDLEPGNDERVDIKFDISPDVDTGTYNMIVEAEGDARNDTSSHTELNFKLEVKKQSHDIRITKILLNPSVIDCKRQTKLTAEARNVGSSNENEIALEFKAPALGVNSFDKDLALQSSNEASDEESMHTKSLNIEIPSFFKAGKYPININLYWKNFVLFDQKIVELTVNDCKPGATVPSEEVEGGGEVEVTGPEETQEPGTGNRSKEETVTATQEVSLANTPVLLAISLGGLLILIFMIVIIAYASRKS